MPGKINQVIIAPVKPRPSSTFVIEALFAIPGLGKHYVQSISNNDYTLVLGMTIFFGAFLILMNLVVDILYGIIDPRIRLSGKGK